MQIARFSIVLLFVAILVRGDEIAIQKLGDTIVTYWALTISGRFAPYINGLSFQQEAIVTHAGHQYLAFYNADRRVCLARRQLPAGSWRTIVFDDYHFASNDAHNVISLGICPSDGTIHLAFDHHVDKLHYRVSAKGLATTPGDRPWAASEFGPIRNFLEPEKPVVITYPRFWKTPDGDLQFCYRRGGSGNGDRMLVDYDGGTGTWSNTRQIDSGNGLFRDEFGSSESRCSYPNGYTYGPQERLHATWVWRESPRDANHDLLYAYSPDRGFTWFNNADQRLNQPPHVNTSGLTVAAIGRDYGLLNTHGQTVDSRGRVHVVMRHCTPESFRNAGSSPGEKRFGPIEVRRYVHHWRERDGTWHQFALPGETGNRPKIFADANDNLILIHGLYLEDRDRDSDLVIQAATAAAKWRDWRVVHREAGPFSCEMLGDPYRWRREGVLSIMVQESPDREHQPTRLRLLDFTTRRHEAD